MGDFITPETARAIVEQSKLISKASVADQAAQRPYRVQILTLDLTTARLSTAPYKINGQFKSVYIQDATDTFVNVQMLLGTNDSLQSAFTLKKNDAFTMSDAPVDQAYLYWTAQSAKSITIVFFVDAEFRSGSQISVTGGGVTINDGSSFTTEVVALTASTATLALASDSTRKKATIQNNTGAAVWFGGSSVSNTGSNLGTRVDPGGIFIWQNTAALYAFSVLAYSGDTALQIMKEF